MGLWADWQAARARRQRVDVYLNHLLRDPEPQQLTWLEGIVGPQVAERELSFARRAIGLIVAERDALDDRTASDVAHQLAPVIQGEARRDPGSGALWSERWRAFTAALAVRGSAEPPAVRLARVVLDGAGVANPTAEQVALATAFVQTTRATMNEHLRAAFGAASLPEDVRPSALRG